MSLYFMSLYIHKFSSIRVPKLPHSSSGLAVAILSKKKPISVGLDYKISIWNCDHFVFIGPTIIFPLPENRKRLTISIVLTLKASSTSPPCWKCHSPIKQMILMSTEFWKVTLDPHSIWVGVRASGELQQSNLIGLIAWLFLYHIT